MMFPSSCELPRIDAATLSSPEEFEALLRGHASDVPLLFMQAAAGGAASRGLNAKHWDEPRFLERFGAIRAKVQNNRNVPQMWVTPRSYLEEDAEWGTPRKTRIRITSTEKDVAPGATDKKASSGGVDKEKEEGDGENSGMRHHLSSDTPPLLC